MALFFFIALFILTFSIYLCLFLFVRRVVSQPKLKRVCPDSAIKTNEDIQKSQTYQQFVRNMENEIRRLQETEHFYNNGESSFLSHSQPNALFSYVLISFQF